MNMLKSGSSLMTIIIITNIKLQHQLKPSEIPYECNTKEGKSSEENYLGFDEFINKFY